MSISGCVIGCTARMSLIQVAVTCLLAAAGHTLEVGVPERFLRPRNFNHHAYTLENSRQYLEETASLPQDVSSLPHPYQFFQRPETRDNPGTSGAPIQFPKVPETAQIEPQQPRSQLNSYFQPIKPQISYYDAINDVSQDEQTLQDVNQQHRAPLRAAFLSTIGQSSPIQFPVTSAAPPSPPPLRYHGNSNVLPLAQPPQKYNNLAPKNYAFSYTVKDGDRGDDFSHSQAHHGALTKGEYRVKLPDGRVQVVSYTADDNGYKADVRYDNEDNTVESPYEPSAVKRKPVYKTPTSNHILSSPYYLQQNKARDYSPVQEVTSRNEQPAYPGNQEVVQFVTPTATPVAITYAVTSTPQPPIASHRFLAPRDDTSTPPPQYYAINRHLQQPDESELFYPSPSTPQTHNFYFTHQLNK